MLTNTGFRPGDAIVLTKPLGVGVITTAIKLGTASEEVVDAALTCMTRLNDDAARIAVASGARGATDVTGFGLLGHLGRAAIESGIDVAIDLAAVPLLPGTRKLAEAGSMPGGSRRNLDWADERLDRGGHDELDVLLLADAQTSGGLVFGVDPMEVDGVLVDLDSTGHLAAVIGRATAGSGRVTLT
jgi:selenide,water dikinase